MSLSGKKFVLLQVDGHLVVLCYKSSFLNYETKDAAALDAAVWTLEDYQDEVWIKDTLAVHIKLGGRGNMLLYLQQARSW